MLETYMVLTCCTSKMPRWGENYAQWPDCELLDLFIDI